MAWGRLAQAAAAAVLTTLGPVPASATTLIVDDDRAQCPSAPYTSVSAAAAVAVDGDEIVICPGNYQEQVVLTTSIRLRAMDGAVIHPATLGQTLASMINGQPVTAGVMVNAPHIAIDGLQIDMGANTLGSCTPVMAGLYLRNASGTVHNAHVTAARVPGMPACDSGVGMLIESGVVGQRFGVPVFSVAHVAMNNVEVSSCQKGGIVANGVRTNIRLLGGTFTGDGPSSGAVQNGVQFGYGAKGRVSAPTISGYASQVSGQTATGILLFRSGRVLMRDVKVSDSQTGIFIVGGSLVQHSELKNLADDGIVALGNGTRVITNIVDGAGVSGVFVNGNNNLVHAGYIANAPVGLWFYGGLGNEWSAVHFADSVPIHAQGVFGGQRDLTDASVSPVPAP